jgi:hypothetical protein
MKIIIQNLLIFKKKERKKKILVNEIILYNKFYSSFLSLIFFGKSEKEKLKNN